MADQDLLELSRLQKKYAALLGDLQKILQRMKDNDGIADDADVRYLKKTQREMDRIRKKMDELSKRLLAR